MRCWCEGENVTVFTRIGNLSEGGVFLSTRTPLKTGSRAMLRFGEAEEAPIQVEATVVWVRGGDEGPSPRAPGMGLMFTGLTSDTLARVREVIATEKACRDQGSGS